MVPFSREFGINQNQTYANVPYVALRTKATSVLGVDSMNIHQDYSDSLTDSTGWIAYDTAGCWYLHQGAGNNKVYIQYIVDGFYESPVFDDTIIFDPTAPTGSLIINNNDKFTNSANVTLKNTLAGSEAGLSQMRFGNADLKNLLKNSGFDTASNWQVDSAIYDDSLALYELPVLAGGNYLYQTIPKDSIAGNDNDTLLLWVDIVTDTISGIANPAVQNCRLAFQYVYTYNGGADTLVTDGIAIALPSGTQARVSHYNLDTCFKFDPQETADTVFLAGRAGIFINGGAGNHGRCFIDNLRLDPIGPANDYTNFVSYDSLKSWTLNSGNGARRVYGQYSDGAGNETGIVFDTIIADTTKPKRKISSPGNGRYISGIVAIKGYAYDVSDPVQHFKQYELQYNDGISGSWGGIIPDSLKTTPKYNTTDTLGFWNTTTVSDGWYYLRLTVRDSALNVRDTTIQVRVLNDGMMAGTYGGFSNHVYGVAAGAGVYIGEYTTGKISRYDANYQLIDTFKLQDSLGPGKPVAIVAAESARLWIANLASHTINRYTDQGVFEYRFGGGFAQPSGIAVDQGGNLWITDRLHHRVKKYNPEGDSLFAFGEKGTAPGKIEEPLGIGIFDNRLYLVDSRNKRISVFDTLGNFVRVLAEAAGLALPFGIVIDSAGCFTVSDFSGDRVVEFDPWGSPLYAIDTLLDAPSCLALSVDGRRLYVSDTKHQRVLVYVLREDPPSGGGPMSGEETVVRTFEVARIYPNPARRAVIVRFTAPDRRPVLVKLYDVTGRLQAVAPQTDARVGSNEVAITAENLSAGVYFVQVLRPDEVIGRKVIIAR